MAPASCPETFRRLGEELGVRLYLVDPATGLSLPGRPGAPGPAGRGPHAARSRPSGRR